MDTGGATTYHARTSAIDSRLCAERLLSGDIRLHRQEVPHHQGDIEPERLHDSYDDEGIGAEGVHQQARESEQEPDRQPPGRGIL